MTKKAFREVLKNAGLLELNGNQNNDENIKLDNNADSNIFYEDLTLPTDAIKTPSIIR